MELEWSDWIENTFDGPPIDLLYAWENKYPGFEYELKMLNSDIICDAEKRPNFYDWDEMKMGNDITHWRMKMPTLSKAQKYNPEVKEDFDGLGIF